MNRHLRVEIHLDAIKRNFNTILERLKTFCPAGSKAQKTGIIGVVKADAYGHGAIKVSKVLQELGIDYLAVAYLDEAIALREEGITVPIIVLFEEPDLQKYLRYDLRAVIYSLKELERIERTAKTSGPPLYVHLKIDTGMGRLGLLPDEALEGIKRIAASGSLRLEGIMSHFSEAELSDKVSALRQLKLFKDLVFQGVEMLKERPILHIANSAALFSLPEAKFSAVRPGLALYGYLPGRLEGPGLLPAMKVKTKLLDVRRLKKGTSLSYGGTFVTKRETIAGVIQAGYADGLMRCLSNRGYVLYNGRKAPIIGRVCMDLTIIDLTDIIKDMDNIDREVVLLGSEGREAITAKDIASQAGTIPYEILTTFGGLGKREFI